MAAGPTQPQGTVPDHWEVLPTSSLTLVNLGLTHTQSSEANLNLGGPTPGELSGAGSCQPTL